MLRPHQRDKKRVKLPDCLYTGSPAGLSGSQFVVSSLQALDHTAVKEFVMSVGQHASVRIDTSVLCYFDACTSLTGSLIKMLIIQCTEQCIQPDIQVYM